MKSGNIRPSNIYIRKAGTNTNDSEKNQAYLPEPSQPPPIIYFKHMNNNIYLDLNITSYYLNHLSSPYISTCHPTVATINQTIKTIVLNKHHRRTA